MPSIGVHTDVERLQKRWVLGALGIAFVIHLVVAWAMVIPMTLGTATVGGPVETVTVTAEPKGAMAPLAGLVEMTMPEAMRSR